MYLEISVVCRHCDNKILHEFEIVEASPGYNCIDLKSEEDEIECDECQKKFNAEIAGSLEVQYTDV